MAIMNLSRRATAGQHRVNGIAQAGLDLGKVGTSSLIARQEATLEIEDRHGFGGFQCAE